MLLSTSSPTLCWLGVETSWALTHANANRSGLQTCGREYAEGKDEGEKVQASNQSLSNQMPQSHGMNLAVPGCIQAISSISLSVTSQKGHPLANCYGSQASRPLNSCTTKPHTILVNVLDSTSCRAARPAYQTNRCSKV